MCQQTQRSLMDCFANVESKPLRRLINISHDNPDLPLKAAQEKICNHLRVVNGQEELIREILKLKDYRGQERVVVDVIAHATSRDQLMIFDGWELRAENGLREAFEALRPVADKLAALRLIGCETGISGAGLQALWVIQRALGDKVEVFGTSTVVSVWSFSNSQYISGALVPAPRGEVFVMPHDAPPAGSSLELRWTALNVSDAIAGEWSKGAMRVEAQRLWREMQGALQPRAGTFPGLLSKPDHTFVVGCGNWQMRIDVLLDWRYLRFWPLDGGEGMLVPVGDGGRAHLEKFLGAPSPMRRAA